MTFEEFNQKRKLVDEARQATLIAPTADGIAHIYMTAMLNGLVITPLNPDTDWMPEPICGFISMPDERSAKHTPHLIFPADQGLPP